MQIQHISAVTLVSCIWSLRIEDFQGEVTFAADIVKMFLPVDTKKSLEWSFRRALPTEKET